MSTYMGNTGMWGWTRTRGMKYTIDRDNRVGTWWYLSSSAKLGSRNPGSCGEVINVMLQGLMSSEVELGVGVTREVWQGSELAKISQQCHVSVTGRNSVAQWTEYHIPDEEAGPQMAQPVHSGQGHLTKCLQGSCYLHPSDEFTPSSWSPYYDPTIQIPSLNECNATCNPL